MSDLVLHHVKNLHDAINRDLELNTYFDKVTIATSDGAKYWANIYTKNAVSVYDQYYELVCGEIDDVITSVGCAYVEFLRLSMRIESKKTRERFVKNIRKIS